MVRVGTREFKNRMGRYMRAVREGKTLVVTDRGKAVAKICPPDADSAPAPTLDQVLDSLVGHGLLHRGKKPFGKFKPISSRGKPASEMIIEDRR